MGLRFCPAKDILASWGVDDFNHGVTLWDIDALKVIHFISGHSGPVKDVCEVASRGASEMPFDPMLGDS